MSEPLISILIPCFNAGPWVHRSIETALGQTWPTKEVIVLDDGSTDNSLEIIRRYEGRVRIATQANGGANASRNHLTRLSRGEWLVYLDADDELALDCVAKEMEFSGAADVVYATMELATFHGTEKVETQLVPADDYPDPWVAAFHWKFPNTSSVMFNRRALLKVGGWDERLKNCTDYELFFKMLLTGVRFKAAPKARTLYRQWSVTQAVNEAPMRLIRTRLELMWKIANALTDAGSMTCERKEAFLNASLGVIRSIYPSDARLAKQEHRRLVKWEPAFRPSASFFPQRYVRAYNRVGFVLAERLASTIRTMKLRTPTQNPRADA